jgi:hypothetical protein
MDPRVDAAGTDSNGFHRASPLAQMGQRDQQWSFLRMGGSVPAGEHGGDSIPDPGRPTMRGDPFLKFHRRAEAAGYPALLIVSVVCLALVVTPILLLGLTDAGWVLALALLNLIVAIGVLAGAVLAALSDVDERAARPASRDVAASDERDPIVPLPRRHRTTRHASDDRRAA